MAAWRNQRRRYQRLRGGVRVAVVAIASLSERLDGKRRSTGRPPSAAAPPARRSTRAQRHAAATADRAGHRRDADQAGGEDDDHDADPDVVDQLLGDEPEDVERAGALRAVAGVHEQREERGQGDGDERPDDRARVHRPGEAGPVVAGDRVAAGRGHELARLGLGRARLRALAAGVAGPQLLARQELVAHADLGVADHPPREGRVVADQRAGRGAGPAAEAGGDVGGAVALQVGERGSCRRGSVMTGPSRSLRSGSSPRRSTPLTSRTRP